MRRATTLVALGIAILAALVLLSYLALVRLGPDRLRRVCEQELSQALGTPVEIGSAKLLFVPGLGLSVGKFRAWPSPDGPGVEADLARVLVHPLPLIFGRVRLDRLDLDTPTLRLVRDAKGLRPRGSEPGWTLPGAGSEDGDDAGLPRRVSVRRGSVSVDDLSDAGLPKLEARVEGDLVGAWLRGPRLELSLSARLGGRPLGEAGVDARLRKGGDVELTVNGLDLSQLNRFADGLDLVGSLDGRLRWRRGEFARGVTVGVAVRGGSTDAGEAGRIDLGNARLDGELRVSPRSGGYELELVQGTLRDEGVEVSGAAALLWGRDTPTRLRRLFLEPMDAATLQHLLARLPGDRLPELRRMVEGTVTFHYDSPTGGEPTFAAELHQVALELGESGELSQLDAAATLENGVLTVRAEPALLGDSPLPAVDVAVSGLDALLRDGLDCVRPMATPALPGWPSLRAALAPKPPDPNEPRAPAQRRVRAHLDWLAHRDLFCQIDDLTFSWVGLEEGFELRIDHGRYGGRPVTGRVTSTSRPTRALDIEIELASGRRPGKRRLGDLWARGDFDATAIKLGPFHTRTVEGRFALRGAALEIGQTHAELDPSGSIDGSLRIDLASLPPRYALRTESTDLTIEGLMRAADLTPAATGGLYGSLRADGPIRPGVPLLSTTEGSLSLHGRDGKLENKLPIVLAVATASNGLGGLGERATRYANLDLTGSFARGRLEFDLSLGGKGLQGQGSGQIELARPYPLEGVLGLFFLRTLDKMVGLVPVVNRVLLGNDQSLIGTYFEVTGVIGQPEASLLPLRSIPGHPDRLPRFVGQGLKRIWAAMPAARDAAPVDPNVLQEAGS